MGEEQSLIRAKLIVEHTKQLPTALPSKIRYHIFELVHNALPTRVREKWRKHSLVCAFCNDQDETIEHLHQCKVSIAAIGRIISFFPNKSDFVHLYDSTEDDYSFISNCPPKKRLILIIFSLAVWRTRRHYYELEFDPSWGDQIAKRITTYFIRTYKSINRKRKRKTRDVQASREKDFHDYV